MPSSTTASRVPAAAWAVLAAVLGLEMRGCECKMKPHIVYVLSDNLGYGNVGFLRALSPTGRGSEVTTPRIDALAEGGVRLLQFYTYKFCSPSRSALLSGRLPIHVNFHNDDQTIPGAGIPIGMTTLAEKLGAAGYTAHHIGKWHVGFATPGHTPAQRGFTSSLGYFWAYNGYLHSAAEQGCPQWPGNSSENPTPWISSPYGTCTVNSTKMRHLQAHVADLWQTDRPGSNGNMFEEELFVRQAEAVIAAHPASEPLFLYYATHLVHSPLCVPPATLARFAHIPDEDRRFVTAMMWELDSVVGRVEDALRKRGLWPNTLFVWTSDNGAAIELGTGAKSSYPLRGGYYSNWQGGVRAPALVTGGILPKVARGSILDGPSSYIHIADWFSTFCGLAGVDPVDERAAVNNLPPIDSLDAWPLISGANRTSRRIEWLLSPLHGDNRTSWSPGPGDAAYIMGPWKLITGNVSQAGWCGVDYPNATRWDPHTTFLLCTTSDKIGCLFNIATDPEERDDLAAHEPELVSRIWAKMLKADAGRYDPDRGSPDTAAACAQVEKNGGYWGPWLT